MTVIQDGILRQSLDISVSTPRFFARLAATLLVLCLGWSTTEPAKAQNSAGGRIFLTTEEQTWLLRHPVIRIGVDNAWPPLEFVDRDGAYSGMAADYLALIEQRLGIELEIETNKAWVEVVEAVKKGDLDGFSLVVDTPQRREYVDFTDSYLSFPYVIVTLDDEPFVDGADGLVGKTVAVVKNYAIHDLLTRDHPALDLHLADTVSAGLETVITGRAYAFVGNLAVITEVLRKEGITNLKVSGQTRYRSNLAMAFRKGLAPAVAIFDKALSSITPEERDAIYARWVRVQFDKKLDTSTIVLVVLVSAFIVLAIILWNRRLQAEIQRRTEIEKALQSARSRTDTLLKAIESSQNGIAILDPEGKYIYLNDAHARIFGYDSASGLLGASWEILYSEEERRKVADQAFSVLASTGKWNGEHRARRRDGSEFDQEIWLTALAGGGLICVCQDISERVKFVNELQAARERAEQANVAKSKFLASMSHEIRTPMNGVLGMVSVLRGHDLTPEQQDSVQVIKDSSEALLDLLNNILDLSKIEAGKIDIELTTFSVERLLEMAGALWATRAEAKGLRFLVHNNTAHCDLIRSDGGRLRQVLFNLIDNAIKFTGSGDVVVQVDGRTRDDERIELRFTVRDSGIGLTAEQRSNLFRPFSQADSTTTRKYGGTGLGLSISKQLVELMGGEMGLDSAPDEGSTFWFTIVGERGETSDKRDDLFSDARPPSPDAPGASRLRILVAEDNHINQKVIKSLLRSLKGEIDIAENGLEAVQAVQRKDYDIVLMDVQMPEMDGPTATREIRALTGAVANIPIIAITANAMKGDREKYLAAGMNDYVSKPIDRGVLFAALQRHANISAPARQNAPAASPAAADSIVDDEAEKSLTGLIDGLREMRG